MATGDVAEQLAFMGPLNSARALIIALPPGRAPPRGSGRGAGRGDRGQRARQNSQTTPEGDGAAAARCGPAGRSAARSANWSIGWSVRFRPSTTTLRPRLALKWAAASMLFMAWKPEPILPLPAGPVEIARRDRRWTAARPSGRSRSRAWRSRSRATAGNRSSDTRLAIDDHVGATVGVGDAAGEAQLVEWRGQEVEIALRRPPRRLGSRRRRRSPGGRRCT